MKKVISILCVFVIAFSFAACTTTVKTEKTVDAVAEALDFSNKQEKIFVLVNASDGAGFDTANGNYAEIYIYSNNVNPQDNADYWGDYGSVTVNDDVLLYLEGDESSEENQEIINKFESLKF